MVCDCQCGPWNIMLLHKFLHELIETGHSRILLAGGERIGSLVFAIPWPPQDSARSFSSELPVLKDQCPVDDDMFHPLGMGCRQGKRGFVGQLVIVENAQI